MAGIYVDPVLACVPNKSWRHMKSCHLFTLPGGLDELHAFAKKIGLRRDWFQHKPGKLPHYDLTEMMMLRAVAAGAVQLNRANTVAIMRSWRQSDQAAKTATPGP